MRWILICLLVICVGCKKSQDSKSTAILHGDGGLVSLNDAPTNVEIKDNIDIVPVLFQIKYHPLKVYVKTDNTEPWIELTEAQINTPTFVYDAMAQQLRFQWCHEGWGYAVDLQ